MSIESVNAKYREELKAIVQYHKHPSDLNFIEKMVKSEVFSSASRGKLARRLYDTVQLANKTGVFFNYQRMEWQPCHKNFPGNNSEIAHAEGRWAKYLRYKLLPKPIDLRGRVVTQVQTNVLYGIELEMYPKGGLQSKHHGDQWELMMAWGDGQPDMCTLRSDGSLNSGGVEFVTAPAPVEVLRNSILTIGRYGVLNKFKVDNKCGVHIHISREALSEIQVANMLFFIHAAENGEFISSIGGRKSGSTSYCQFASSLLKKYNITKPYQIITTQTPEFKKEFSAKIQEHYSAMSWSRRHPTYEFRIFNGSTDPQVISRYLEFVAALVDFAMTGATKQDASWELFCRWLSDPHRRGDIEPDRVPKKLVDKHPRYPILYKHLQASGFIDAAWFDSQYLRNIIKANQQL